MFCVLHRLLTSEWLCDIIIWVMEMEEKTIRKKMRLQRADYNSPGVYFITVCTKNRRCILSRIVGTGVLDGPATVELLPYGKIAEKYLNQLNEFYNDISVERYVIMPNHIHMLLFVKPSENNIDANMMETENGPSRTPVPTIQNSIVSRFVSTFKRFCNKEYGKNIWQYRSYDHIIRNQKDYEEHINYIYTNPMHWYYDELYTEE